MAWGFRNYNAALREIQRQLPELSWTEAQAFYSALVDELGPGITAAKVRRWFEEPEDWLDSGEEIEITATTQDGTPEWD